MRLKGLRTAAHAVKDLEQAKLWYAQLLGVDPYFDEPFYVGFDIGGYEFGLAPGDAGVGGSVFYWATEDPQQFVAKAVSLGAVGREPVRDVGDGIQLGTFIDPFGNEFGVIRNPHFAPHLVAAQSEDIADAIIECSVVVSLDSKSAWDMWATEEGLASWWTEHAVVDLRPGGKYEIHFLPDEAPGDKGGDWCRVLSFLPGRMLSFTWNAPPTLKTRPEHTWVVLTFEAVDEGCRVNLSHLGWPGAGLADTDSDWPATFEYFTTAWQYVMDLFQGRFSGQ